MATVRGTSSSAGGMMRTVVTLVTGLLLLGSDGVSSADRHVFPVTLTSQPAEAAICSFPDAIVMEIKSSPPFPESLVVYRNDVIDTNAPTFVISNRENGVVHLSEIGSANKETAAYKNSDEGAAFMVRCTTSGVEIAGTMYVEGLKYRVSRVEAETETDTETAGRHQFVLAQDTPHHDTMLQGFAKRKLGSTKEQPDAMESRRPRTKRATGAVKDYYIDVLVVLDFSFYNFWLNRAGGNSILGIQNAKEYINYIFNGVNSRYDTISKSSFDLHVVLSGFIVVQTANESPWTEGPKEPAVGGARPKVKAERVLTLLEMYVRESYTSLPAHDHLMVFTEYDLYTSGDDGFRFNNTAGFAFLDSVCKTNGQSISVVEDHGGFQSEATVTHELGHSFGARHDGYIGDNGNNCSSDDRYVMSGGVHPFTEATKRNPWVFSPCSDRYFQSHFDFLVKEGFEESCLLNRTNSDNIISESALPGQSAGPDDQCRQIYGSESYLCRGTNFGTPERVCFDMYCRNPALSGTQCTLNTAAHGTCCSNGKQCDQGECKSLAANDTRCYMSATCPFGQRQGQVYQGKTCDELEPQYCYTTDFRLVCCEMCDRVKANNGTDGCTYGDSVLGCVAQSCGVDSAVGRAYDQNCCGTCREAQTTLTTAAPPDVTTVVATIIVQEVHALSDLCSDNALITINNQNETCSAYINTHGPAFCCQSALQESCCASCGVHKTSDPECLFGDCQICTNLINRPITCTQQERTDCCKTCKDVDLRLTTPVPSSTTPTTTTTTTIAITAKPNTAAPGDGGGGEVKPVVTCIAVAGVTTCGSLQLWPSLALLCVCLLAGRCVLGDGLGQ